MNMLDMLWIAIGLSAVMTGAWAIQRLTGNSGWIDTVWSAAVGIGGIFATMLPDHDAWPLRSTVAMLLVAVWSARLALHIAGRSSHGTEDPRYAKLIEEWGDNASLRLFLFLQVQALCAFVLVLAVYLAASNPAPFPSILDIVAVMIGLGSIAGEGISDAQLARFRRTPQARITVCETGLWAYSRHPNYFFEWLFWCAWPLLAFNPAAPFGWGLAALLAPALMYWLLVHVSGIPPLEAHMLRSRGQAFRDLQARVNAFFPGPRREARTTATQQSSRG